MSQEFLSLTTLLDPMRLVFVGTPPRSPDYLASCRPKLRAQMHRRLLLQRPKLRVCVRCCSHLLAVGPCQSCLQHRSLLAACDNACSTQTCACLQINPAAGAAIAQAFASATATAGAGSPVPAKVPASPVATPAPTIKAPAVPVATSPPATKAPSPPSPSPSPAPAGSGATAAANATAAAGSSGVFSSLLHSFSGLPTAHQYRLGTLLASYHV